MDAMTDTDDKKGDEAKEGLLEEARERLQAAIDADSDNRIEALDDLRMLAGIDHWPEDLKTSREAKGQPCLIVNQLPQFHRQVTGDIRSTNPSIKVTASDDSADERVAEVYEGLIRQIQNRSDASSVYERAAESAAACGMGYFRVLFEYEHEGSFNQDIRIESISNPFSVYFDPNAMLSTRSDAEWCFITSSMSEDEFREEYPDAAVTPVENDGITDNLSAWRDGKDIIIAEYFWKERKPVKLYLMADGTTLVDPEKAPAKRQIIKTRDGVKTVVKWAKISGGDVLEGPQVMPGRHLPVIAIVGEELYLGDRVYRSSVIRHAKDPQRIFDMMWSVAVQTTAMQTQTPWLVTPAQVAGFETFWATPDNGRATLPYNPDPMAPGAPQRIQPPLASQGITDLLNRSAMELRSTTGIQDAALGARSGEKSGVAIRQRQQESDNSTSIYADNMGKAIAHCGRVIVAAAPEIYDTARTLRVIAKDGTAGMERINEVQLTEQGPQMIDLSQGQFEVEVEVGPNYATRMQSALDGMMQFMQINPQSAMLIGDLMAKNMDWPGADQIAERLKAALPPGIAGDEQQQPDPAQMQAMQMQQQEQMRMAEMGKIMQELEIRQKVAEASKAEAQATEAQAKAMQAQVEARAAGMMPAPMQT